MSASALATYLFDHHHAPHPSTSQLHDTSVTAAYSHYRSNNSMFGNLKKKLNRRSSNPLTQKSTGTNKSPTEGGFLTPGNSNPFTSGTPPTRRPSGSRGNPLAQRSANDPPPAYTPTTANAEVTAYQPPVAAVSDEDPYAFLRNFDTIFLIDDSGSMAGSRWREVAEALKVIAPICAMRDEDGVDVWFLNDKKVWRNNRTAEAIKEIFTTVDPRGQTFTGKRLYEILTPYLAEYKRNPSGTKPVNIIVITDGEAHDDVSGTIMDVAKKLDKWEAPPWQVGIQFFQIGKDNAARKMLKELDDDLASNNDLRDIVDTVPFKDDADNDLSLAGVMKVVLGSVNRRLDRGSKELHRSR